MIKNDKQYQVTKNRLKEFEGMLEEIDNENLDPIYKKIEMDAVQSQIIQFEREIEDYESLKQGKLNHIYVESLSNFYEVLIKARIIKQWTHADLAKRLELKEQQIQRYEMENYAGASILRITEVASALDIDMKPIKVKFAPTVFNLPAELGNEVPNAFKKMKERGLASFV
jgi:HTH-type transcriptional regulator/antitoxin HipB